jgi:hypothetical protein
VSFRQLTIQPPKGAAPSSIQAQNDPAPVLVARLAAAAGLVVAEKSLVGRPGERVVFSCNGLKHRVSPDGGTLTLTHISELANLWINVLRIEINRDCQRQLYMQLDQRYLQLDRNRFTLPPITTGVPCPPPCERLHLPTMRGAQPVGPWLAADSSRGGVGCARVLHKHETSRNTVEVGFRETLLTTWHLQIALPRLQSKLPKQRIFANKVAFDNR